MVGRRPNDEPRNPFHGARIVDSADVRVINKQRRFLRMKLALETIANLEMFEDPADAATAAVRIAREALK